MADRPPAGTGRSVVVIGECMLELVRDGDAWRMGYAGDTCNTATYLARLGERVAFLTAIGTDPFSAAMLDSWRREGLDTALVLTAPDRLPGLYAVQTHALGERSFYYWREQAAVRSLPTLPGFDDVLARACGADLLYLSGITLALFDAAARAALAQVAGAVRERRGAVAFDPNYRPRLWSSPAAAREAMRAFAPFVSIALPTFDDKATLHGDTDPAETLARWHRAGADEVVVKLGAAGCVIDDGSGVAPAPGARAVDTTGAGDAFNAGYLAARRAGSGREEAAARANALAGQVINCRGAILPRDTSGRR